MNFVFSRRKKYPKFVDLDRLRREKYDQRPGVDENAVKIVRHRSKDPK